MGCRSAFLFLAVLSGAALPCVCRGGTAARTERILFSRSDALYAIDASGSQRQRLADHIALVWMGRPEGKATAQDRRLRLVSRQHDLGREPAALLRRFRLKLAAELEEKPAQLGALFQADVSHFESLRV